MSQATDPFAGMELATDEVRRMELVHPVTGMPLRRRDGKGENGEDSIAFIELYSNDSERAKVFDRKGTDLRLKSRSRPTAEELEEEQYQRLAWLSAGWNLAGLDGEPIEVPFNQSNAIAFYKRFPWVQEQVLDFTRNRANFRKV